MLSSLLGCSASGGLDSSPADPLPTSLASTELRIDIEAAILALDASDDRLAADLLSELLDLTSGAEHRFLSALLLEARGQTSLARTAMEALVSESTDLEEWLLADLVGRLGEQRLAERHSETERELEVVLNRHYEARGGAESMQALTDMIVYGTLRSRNIELGFRLVRKRPRFHRIDLYTPGGRQIEAVDGQTPWRLLSPYRQEDGTYFGGRERQLRLETSYFDDILLRFRDTGERLYLAPSEIFEERRVDRIEIDYPSGRVQTVLLDQATGLDVRRLDQSDPDTPPTRITIEYSDFDGRMLPASQVVESPNGTVEYDFESYDFESPIDPAAFDLETVRQRLLAERGGDSTETGEPTENGSQ